MSQEVDNAGVPDFQKFKINIPQNLDDVFSANNMRFTEMKGFIKNLFETMQKIGMRMEDLDYRFVNKL